MTFRSGVTGGVGLLLLTLFSWFLHVTSASAGAHSWNSGQPPATVVLRTGHLYHLSTAAGASALPGSAEDSTALSCSYSSGAATATATASGQDIALTVDRIPFDARILHRIGTFTAPESGPLSIACADVDAVYVDDATSADFDRAGLFVVTTCLLGLTAVVVGCGGLMKRQA